MSRYRKDIGFAKSLVALMILVMCLAASLFVLLNRQLLVDYATNWSFKPTDSVVDLAKNTSMNKNGKFIFYASRPQLQAAKDFNNECQKQEQMSAILGCYTRNQIFIYDIQNTELAGIKEVTAAHEMLHAAYDRLDDKTKERVNIMLENEYQKLKNDQKLAERMAMYDRLEPGQRDNELHSIVGTEIASIDSGLEDYYKKYFDDRSVVIKHYDTYSSVFRELEQKSNDLEKRVTDLSVQIQDAKLDYDMKAAALQRDINSFNSAATNGSFNSRSEFNSTRSALMIRADNLDMARADINAKITEFNNLTSQLKSLALHATELNNSIDSTLAPAPSL